MYTWTSSFWIESEFHFCLHEITTLINWTFSIYPYNYRFWDCAHYYYRLIFQTRPTRTFQEKSTFKCPNPKQVSLFVIQPLNFYLLRCRTSHSKRASTSGVNHCYAVGCEAVSELHRYGIIRRKWNGSTVRVSSMAIKLTPSNNGDDGYYGDNVRVYVPTTYYSPVGISPDKWWVCAKETEKYWAM